MKILITGAHGQLGRALLQCLEPDPSVTLLAVDKDELDITVLTQVTSMLRDFKPDVVINCAAATAVDDCEKNHTNAFQINAIGPLNLAVICNGIAARLVHISTDYVFSGQPRKTPWVEDDITEPQNIYGTSKLLGEQYVKAYCPQHFIVRTAWLYGDGHNFVNTMLDLSKTHPEINVVGDQFGNPTYTKDLAQVIINLIQTDHYGTYHATNEGICSWYDFACKIFEIADVNVKVNKITTAQFPRPAKRPIYSALENNRLNDEGLNSFRNWEVALADYLS
ncbi:MAG: dTDP-4-dehydrorhamnose reductase [Epulopiscium sp. Nuni2H_MBin001]|nr:MAG: dTDP-4-dehydrorhamnose reductase [Epulopiscium sp. Nuni2H_MBin001]